MNNKGFTLIEVIITFGIITILTVTITYYIGNSFSISKETAYDLMKDNIISASYSYISECDNEFLECRYEWHNNETKFTASVLKKSGYIDSLDSPIDNIDLSECIIVHATKTNGVVDVTLEDNCY